MSATAPIEAQPTDPLDTLEFAGMTQERFFRASREQPPWNLHLESTPDGALAWIAMHDADAAEGTLLSSLVPRLRDELAAQGRSLFQVVCNGRLIWRDPMASSDPGPDAAAEVPAPGYRPQPIGGQRTAHESRFFPTLLKDA